MDMNEVRLEAQDLNQQGAILLKAGNVEAAKDKFDRAFLSILIFNILYFL